MLERGFGDGLLAGAPVRSHCSRQGQRDQLEIQRRKSRHIRLV
jgi:hypothetical protein